MISPDFEDSELPIEPESEPDFKEGDRVMVGPNGMTATVIRQIVHYDGPDVFYGNVELLYDDGVKGVSHSWQVKKTNQERK
jgi:hypothetical protein